MTIGRRATLKPEPDSQVYGVLMELSQTEIQRVYAAAGVQEYRAVAVIVEPDDGRTVPALCFNLPGAPDPGEVDEAYAQKLRDLALRVGLPASHLRTIK